MVAAWAMNSGLKTKTKIVISGRILVLGLILRCIAESACKRYVWRALDILVMKGKSVFLRQDFAAKNSFCSRAKFTADFFKKMVKVS